jgi:hypothetical protein
MTCRQCNQTIEPGENFARFKKPRTNGDKESDYDYYHHRQKGNDCYWVFLRDLVVQAQKRIGITLQ